ncbi:MAG: SH3 domain-containing protein [Chloroflexota bacterium]|nr:SH3 domain-containing protein [Chloroflexota bacterium]
MIERRKKQRAARWALMGALALLMIAFGVVVPIWAQTSGTGWTVSYFNSPDLSGATVLTQTLPGGIDFNYGTNSPATGVNPDNWSARFVASQNFAAGTYQFLVGSDDGVRVRIDGNLVLDKFTGRTFTTDTFVVSLSAGTHSLIVEYFDGIDLAILQFQYVQVFNITPTFGTLIPTTPAPTIFVTLTAPATSTQPPCPTPGNFVVGQDVLLRGGVNLRSLPTLSGAVTNYYPNEVRLRLIAGPICADGYQWWRVEGVGEPGWVAEGQPGLIFLFPAAPLIDPANVCFTPLPMTIGGTARVLNNVRIRGTPSQIGRTLTILPEATVVTILEGPRCSSQINWWRVNANGLEGWVAEGFPGNYWLSSQNVPFTAIEPSNCGRALELVIGSRIAVIANANNPRPLRTDPTINAGVVATLIDGIALEVIGGSVCAEQMIWWQVRVVPTTITGWISQGRPGDPILEPLVR